MRDTYDLGGGLLLMVATDRISAFDVVLPTAIPEKGVVLANISAFWFAMSADTMPNHFICMANDAANVPGLSLSDIPAEIARRAMVVKRAQRLDVECIARGYITRLGVGRVSQERHSPRDGYACGPCRGRQVPPNPSSRRRPRRRRATTCPCLSRSWATWSARRWPGPSVRRPLGSTPTPTPSPATRASFIADTKLEFGLLDGELIVIDELLTPDSSRFWDAEGYAPGKSQPNYDKQFVRDALTAMGWDREPPAPELSADVVDKTRSRYLEAYQRLTGQPLP